MLFIKKPSNRLRSRVCCVCGKYLANGKHAYDLKFCKVHRGMLINYFMDNPISLWYYLIDIGFDYK